MALDTVDLTILARGITITTLGAWLLYVRPHSSLHRAAATFLFLHGVRGSFGLAYGTRVFDALLATGVYFAIGITGAAVWLGLQFFASHGASTRRAPRGTGWLLLLVVAATSLLYAITPHPDRVAWRVFEGPALTFAPAAVGLWSAVMAHRTAPGTHRRGMTILAVALLLYPAFGTTLSISRVQFLWQSIGASGMLVAALMVEALTVFMILAGAAIMSTKLDRPAMAGAIVLAILTGSAPRAIWEAIPGLGTTVWFIVLPMMWSLIGASMLVYALTHARVYRIDLVLKRSLRTTTAVVLSALAVTMTWGVIVLASETTLWPASWPRSATIAVGSAVVLAATYRPFQRTALRFVDAVLPGVEQTPTYHDRRRLEVYRGAVEDAAADGLITPDEETFILDLRSRYEISSGDAIRAERQALAGQTMSEHRALIA